MSKPKKYRWFDEEDDDIEPTRQDREWEKNRRDKKIKKREEHDSLLPGDPKAWVED